MKLKVSPMPIPRKRRSERARKPDPKPAEVERAPIRIPISLGDHPLSPEFLLAYNAAFDVCRMRGIEPLSAVRWRESVLLPVLA